MNERSGTNSGEQRLPLFLFSDPIRYLLPNADMAFAESLNHAVACQLAAFLEDAEVRRLATASKTVHEACQPYRKTFGTPFCKAEQWKRCIARLPRVERLRVYPNALKHVYRIQMQHLVDLDLTASGLASHNIHNSLVQGLKRAAKLRHLAVSNNPRLQTSGLSRLLRALAVSKTQLLTLKASATGIRRLPLVDKPLLANITTLALTQNKLAPSTVHIIFQHLVHLEFAGIDVFEADALPHANVRTISWWRCTPATMETHLASLHAISASLFCMHPGRWTFTGTAISPNLQRLCLGSVFMPSAAWKLLLKTLATTATIHELRVWSTDTPLDALLTFVQSHRSPHALESFGIAYNEQFCETHLRDLCQAMIDRDISLNRWILRGCRRLRLVDSADAFVATLRPHHPVHLDLAVATPTNLNRRAEARWFNHLFRHAGSFSYLDVSQRCIILEDDLRPDLFADIEHLCLRNTEINWGLDVPMPKLRNLSLSNVESRIWTPSDLFHQALKQPIIANIKMDYSHLEHYDFSSQAKHVTTLGLDWISTGAAFFERLSAALADGDFPSLSSLHVAGSASPSDVCQLVASMREKQRHCHIDCRYKCWQPHQIQRLASHLASLIPEDLSSIRLVVAAAAQPAFDEMKQAFPSIAFEAK